MNKAEFDFTSALYLGLRHPSASLLPWSRFTTGVPYALAVPPEARSAEETIAKLQGFQRAILGPSTLHLFWDLFSLLATRRIVIYIDQGAYPISKWGVERAAALGTPVRSFQHQDANHVARLLRVDARIGRRPVIVSDGFCPGCGRAAPFPAYLKIVRRSGGYLVIDDTQALGIFGQNPDHHPPYGLGGGGMLRWYGIKDPRVINISSLAKGFGAPIAVLSGNEQLVRCFEANSETRIHTSPPSIATIRAVEHALAINSKNGDSLRSQLAQRVAQFRRLMKNAGIMACGGFFPVQAIKVPEKSAERIHRRLREQGVRTVLQQCCASGKPFVAFVISALHREEAIERAVEVFVRAVCDIQNSGCAFQRSGRTKGLRTK